MRLGVPALLTAVSASGETPSLHRGGTAFVSRTSVPL
jgi:hypothetical protein